MRIYFPLIKIIKNIRNSRNSERVSNSARTNTCCSFPWKTPCRETGLHFLLGWLLQQEGNLSPLTMVSPVSRSCLSLVPLPTIWPENQVPVKGKILNLGLRRRVLQGVPSSPMLNSCWEICRALVKIVIEPFLVSTLAPSVLKSWKHWAQHSLWKRRNSLESTTPPQEDALQDPPALWAACAGLLPFLQRHFHSGEAGEISLGRLRQAQRKLMVKSTLFSLLECFIVNQESPLSNCCDLK